MSFSIPGVRIATRSIAFGIFMILLLPLVSGSESTPDWRKAGVLELTAGPTSERLAYRSGDAVKIKVDLMNSGRGRAQFEVRLEIFGPNGRRVFASHQALGRPGQKVATIPKTRQTVAFAFNAPGDLGAYSARVQVRNIHVRQWQIKSPLLEVFRVADDAPSDPVRAASTGSGADVTDACRALIEARGRNDIAGVIAMVAGDFRGATDDGGLLDRNLLERSLRFDREQLEDLQLTIESMRMREDGNDVAFDLDWSMRYRHKPTGVEMDEKGRRTRLLFRRVGDAWKLIGQSGSSLIGRSDPLTGGIDSPEIRAAQERQRMEDEARRPADVFTESPITEEIRKPMIAWSADEFVARVRTATDAIIAAYQRESLSDVTAHVSRDYRGVHSRGGNVDYYGLPQSLQCDYQIFDNFLLTTVTAESFRLFESQRQAEIVLIWDARAHLLSSSQDIVMQGRRTRLVFADEDGAAKLLYQDIASVINGSVLFGMADPSNCIADLRADASSQTGGGTIQVVGPGSGSTDAGTVHTTTASGALTGGTLSSNYTVTQNSTLTSSVIVPAGVTLTINSGVTLTFSSGTQLEISGTLTMSGAATITGTAWQGLVFKTGSTGTLTSPTISGATNGTNPSGILVEGGTVTATNVTLTGNERGYRIEGGSLTIDGGSSSGNTTHEGRQTGGTLTLQGTLDINAASSTAPAHYSTGGNLTVAGNVTFRGATGGNPGIHWGSSGTATIGGVATFRNNTGAGLLTTAGTLSSTNSNFMNNTGHGIASTIACGSASFSNAFVSNNNGMVGAQVQAMNACVAPGSQVSGSINVASAFAAAQN